MSLLAPQHNYQQQVYPNHSIMEDASDDGDDEEDPYFYEHQHQQQQQQAIYCQQRQQQQQQSPDGVGQTLQVHPQVHVETGDGIEDEEMYSDDESSTASVPDENIDFSLTYALYVYLAFVAEILIA